MINSLSKDSHIVRGNCYIKQAPLPESVRQKSGLNTPAIKNGIIMNKPAEPSFCGFLNAEKFYKSPVLKKALGFADEQQLVFGAAYALFLTCVMRPLSIMLFPSKKNQDDQKYASAHSIASGLIGFAISTVVFTPVSSGIKKFTKNPEKFIKDKGNYLLKDKKAMSSSKVYLDRLPDIITAVPKGILTIALIPPIMKYVFKMEKKGTGADKKATSNQAKCLNFNCQRPLKKGKDPFAKVKGGNK